MFTGIISHLGKLEIVKGYRYTFTSAAPFFKNLKKGGSVSVNGICLTLVAAPARNAISVAGGPARNAFGIADAGGPKKNRFSVEVMPETLKRTILGELRVGDYVNLELPMSANGLFAGHIVQGHIDGTGTIASISKESNNSWIFKINISQTISKYLIEKGSVAVNGISFTIIDAGSAFFTVGVIPHTWNNTMLKYSKVGDKVNIEVDVFAKYAEKLLQNYESGSRSKN